MQSLRTLLYCLRECRRAKLPIEVGMLLSKLAPHVHMLLGKLAPHVHMLLGKLAPHVHMLLGKLAPHVHMLLDRLPPHVTWQVGIFTCYLTKIRPLLEYGAPIWSHSMG